MSRANLSSAHTYEITIIDWTATTVVMSSECVYSFYVLPTSETHMLWLRYVSDSQQYSATPRRHIFTIFADIAKCVALHAHVRTLLDVGAIVARYGTIEHSCIPGAVPSCLNRRAANVARHFVPPLVCVVKRSASVVGCQAFFFTRITDGPLAVDDA